MSPNCVSFIFARKAPAKKAFMPDACVMVMANISWDRLYLHRRKLDLSVEQKALCIR